jgi:hypothetical protein
VTAPALLVHAVSVAGIGEAGMTESVVAPAAERAAIARAFGLLELRRLEAEVTLAAGRRGAVDIAGSLRAEVVQSCVVTLVPVVQVIDVALPRRFEPARPPGAGMPEIVVEADDAEPVDAYADGRIDLGAVVLEELALAIDPYPHAPGADLPPGVAGAPAPESPFMALAALRNRAR